MSDRNARTAALVWTKKDKRKTKGPASGVVKLDDSNIALSGTWEVGKGMVLEGGEWRFELRPYKGRNPDERLRGAFVGPGGIEMRCSVFLSGDERSYIVRPWDAEGGTNDVTPF